MPEDNFAEFCVWRDKYEKHSVAVMQRYFYIYLDFVDIFC